MYWVFQKFFRSTKSYVLYISMLNICSSPIFYVRQVLMKRAYEVNRHIAARYKVNWPPYEFNLTLNGTSLSYSEHD